MQEFQPVPPAIRPPRGGALVSGVALLLEQPHAHSHAHAGG